MKKCVLLICLFSLQAYTIDPTKYDDAQIKNMSEEKLMNKCDTIQKKLKEYKAFFEYQRSSWLTKLFYVIFKKEDVAKYNDIHVKSLTYNVGLNLILSRAQLRTSLDPLDYFEQNAIPELEKLNFRLKNELVLRAIYSEHNKQDLSQMSISKSKRDRSAYE